MGKIVKGTNIEIVKPFDGTKLRAVLFDFDGTLSLERDFWPEVMAKMNYEAMIKAPGIHVRKENAWNMVLKEIEETIGVPTYLQMARLASTIESLGGKAKKPEEYNKAYREKIERMVATKRKEDGPDKLRMPNSLELLRALSKRFGKSLYLASGTDVEYVWESVKFLKLERYFPKKRIVGAGSTDDPMQCAKELVIERLQKDKDIKLKPGELVCFGDGVPELFHTKNAGGIGVGVLSPDLPEELAELDKFDGFLTPDKKRRRLITAGAQVLVDNFKFYKELVEIVCSEQG